MKNVIYKVSSNIFWPGKPPGFACEEHAKQIKGVGNFLGTYIHLEPDSTGECQQLLSAEEQEKRKDKIV